MSLQMITFRRCGASPGKKGEGKDPSDECVTAQYNPTEITFEKGVQIAETVIPGIDSPILQFVSGRNETLALDLFFDRTDEGMDGTAKPVTEFTDKFYQLVKIDPATHAPPILEVSWGANTLAGAQLTAPWSSQSRSTFKCLLENVQQRFTLFSPEGVPLRATLSVRLKEYYPLQDQITKIGFQSADHSKFRAVQAGDTLSSIAFEEYDDPAAWRAIADHNGIVDPLDLEVGRKLEIPPLV
jgi:hypothetical protein